MKRFRVKDLMIQALPERLERRGNYNPDCFWPTQGCGWTEPVCPDCTEVSLVAPLDKATPILPSLEPEELVVLKGRLNDLLAQVEQHEQRLSERDRPQTLDEVTALEDQLKAALEELKVRRNELSGEAKQ